MNFPEFDTTPQALDIPEQYLHCPSLSAINADYLKAQEFQDFAMHIGEASLKGMPPEIREAFTEHLSDAHGASHESAEDIIDAMEASSRVRASDTLEVADNAVNTTVAVATEIIAGCQGGPIKMRAVRDGAAFTVRICTSLAWNPYNEAADITRTAQP